VRRLAATAVTAASVAVAVGAGASAEAATSIGVKDDAFAPKSVTVARGSSVRWVWRGRKPHNVNGPGFTSGVKKRGSYARRFRRAGRYKIFCTLHAGMEMTVRVR